MTAGRSTYCWCTVLALLVLRLVIGWHFYSEGTKHITERGWTSEGFLLQAKGPLADKYQSVLGDFHGWADIMRGDKRNADPGAWSKAARDAWEVEKQAKFIEFDKLPEEQRKINQAVFAWQTAQADAWRADFGQLNGRYQLTDDQKQKAESILNRRQKELRQWVDEHREALVTHWNDTHRVDTWEVDPSSGDVPFEKKRILDRQKKLDGEKSAWLADLIGMNRGLHTEFAGVLDDAQRSRGLPADSSRLAQVDLVMKYFITAVARLLIVGLLTRLASLAGAVFLASVALSQPFWLPESAPTYPFILEMLTLLMLATTPVGRWGGLDFFLQSLVCRRCSANARKQP